MSSEIPSKDEVFDHPSGTELLDAVSVFGGQFGHENIDNHLLSFFDTIKQNPQKVHFLEVIGRPAVGKTRLTEHYLAALTAEGSLFMQFVEEGGYDLEIYLTPWGERLGALPDTVRVEGIDYQENSQLLSKKKRELEMADSGMAQPITKIIRNNDVEIRQGEDASIKRKKIKIVAGDYPATSGAVVNGQVVGMLRGYNFLYELGNHTGRFEELSPDDYDVTFIFVDASSEVRQHAIFDKTVIIKSGEVPEGEVMAQPIDITTIDAEVAAVDIALLTTGEVESPKSKFETDEQYYERLSGNSEEFTNFNGTEALPWFARTFGVTDSNRVIFVYNDIELEKVTEHSNIAKYHPFREES